MFKESWLKLLYAIKRFYNVLAPSLIMHMAPLYPNNTKPWRANQFLLLLFKYILDIYM